MSLKQSVVFYVYCLWYLSLLVNGKGLRENIEVSISQTTEEGLAVREEVKAQIPKDDIIKVKNGKITYFPSDVKAALEKADASKEKVYHYDLYEAALGLTPEEIFNEDVDSQENIFEYKGKERRSSSEEGLIDGSESSKFTRGAWLFPKSRKWPWCGWPATTDTTIFAPLLMDPKAVYQPQLVQFENNDYDNRRVYRFKSSYQQGIYFSYTLE